MTSEAMPYRLVVGGLRIGCRQASDVLAFLSLLVGEAEVAHIERLPPELAELEAAKDVVESVPLIEVPA